MRGWRQPLLWAVVGVWGAVASAAAVKPGQAAPEFKLNDASGHVQSLSAQKGKWVVLEWLNHGCPFVKKHYDAGNMQALQTKYTGKGVVWFSVISSAPGKQGAGTGAQVLEEAKEKKSAATAILIDSDGKTGRAYGAQTTPDMYVISPKGTLVYMGAIDDKASTEVSDIPNSKNYVAAALDEAMAGKPVTTASTKSYGCSVKY